MNEITVIIPTFNASAFIEETLQSVFAQTLLPAEIIVVDDCSTDNTCEIVERLASSSPAKLTLIRLAKNSGGPAHPMNVGIERASTDWIALLDHDDLFVLEYLESKAAAAQRHPEVDFVFSDYVHFNSFGIVPNSHGRSLGSVYNRVISNDCSDAVISQCEIISAFIARSALPLSCSNQFFRRSVWQRASGYRMESGVCADYEFLCRAIEHDVVWIDKELFCKRIHGANLLYSSFANDLIWWNARWAAACRLNLALSVKADLKNDLQDLVWEARHTQQLWQAFLQAIRLTLISPRVGIVELFKSVFVTILRIGGNVFRRKNVNALITNGQ